MRSWLKAIVIVVSGLSLSAAAGIGYVFTRDDTLCTATPVFPDTGLRACMRDAAAGGTKLAGLYTMSFLYPATASLRQPIERAAAGGHIGANAAIGFHHYFGLPNVAAPGQVHDPAQAITHLRPAADGGHPVAQELLGSAMLARTGAISAQEALRWRLILEQRPDRTTPVSSAKPRENLAARLTEAERREAQQEATEWLAGCRKDGRCDFDPEKIR